MCPKLHNAGGSVIERMCCCESLARYGCHYHRETQFGVMHERDFARVSVDKGIRNIISQARLIANLPTPKSLTGKSLYLGTGARPDVFARGQRPLFSARLKLQHIDLRQQRYLPNEGLPSG